MTKGNRRFLSVIAGSLAVLSFLVLSSFAVVWANGLRYNPTSGSFDRTVLIAIDSERTEATVSINGEKVADSIPYRARHLLPSSYRVEISKAGYNNWIQDFELSVGQVGLINNPILIAAKPLVTDSESGLIPKELPPLDYGLNLSGGELTDRGSLVTRFASSPLQVHRFNGFYLYQDGSELRLFIPAGTQDYLIYNSEQATKLDLELFESNWLVALTDGSQVKLINLTIPTVSER